MVDFNHNGNGSNGGEPGGKGHTGQLGHTKTQDNKLVAMMLNPRRRWKLSKEAKAAAISATLDNLADEDARVRNGAVANLLRMEAQNQSDQHKAIDKKVPDLQAVAGVVEHRLTVADLLQNQQYIEWLRERERNSEPGIVCQNGHEGNGRSLENGSTRNGH